MSQEYIKLSPSPDKLKSQQSQIKKDWREVHFHCPRATGNYLLSDLQKSAIMNKEEINKINNARKRGLQKLKQLPRAKKADFKGGVEVEGSLANGKPSAQSYIRPVYNNQKVIDTFKEIFHPKTDQLKSATTLTEILLGKTPGQIYIAKLALRKIFEITNREEKDLQKALKKLEKRDKDGLIMLLMPSLEVDKKSQLGLSITKEFAAHQWELCSRVLSPFNQETVAELKGELDLSQLIIPLISDKDNPILPQWFGSDPAKTLPSIEEISNNPRYAFLIEGIDNLTNSTDPHYTSSFNILFTGTKGNILVSVDPEKKEGEIVDSARKRAIKFHNISVLIESLSTSFQIHWNSIDQANYLRDHRLADLLSAPLMAVATNAPFAYGVETGFKDCRTPIGWLMGTHPMHHTEKHPVLDNGWLENDLHQIEIANALHPILPPSDNVGKGTDFEDPDIATAIEATKTYWPLVRTTLSKNEKGELVTRLEFRPLSSGPTSKDMIANMLLFYGLMQKMPEYLLTEYGLDLNQNHTSLESNLPYEAVIGNFKSACLDGLDAEITWPSKANDPIKLEKRQAKDLLLEILPVAREGLLELGFKEDFIDQYIGNEEQKGVIYDRLTYQLPQDLQERIVNGIESVLYDIRRRYPTLMSKIENIEISPPTSEIEQRYIYALKTRVENLTLLQQDLSRVGWTPADVTIFFHRLLDLEKIWIDPLQKARQLSLMDNDYRVSFSSYNPDNILASPSQWLEGMTRGFLDYLRM